MTFDRPIPERGETWRHYEGSLCHVLQVAEHPRLSKPDPRSGRPRQDPGTVVVYECSKAPGKVWYRDLPEWMGKAMPGSVDRFALADPPAEGTACRLCGDPATMWLGLVASCGLSCDGVPF